MADNAGRIEPRGEYSRRRDARQRRLEVLTVREWSLGLARVVVFMAGLGLAWIAFGAGRIAGWWLAIPIAIFLVLLILHEKVQQMCRRAERAVAFYENGLARLDERWRGRGASGQRYLEDQHPCAADLDLFGVGSVFERVCQTRTLAGEDVLAAWLRNPTEPSVVRDRQQAVAELREQLDLREELACVGLARPNAADFSEVVRWGTAEAVLVPRWPRWPILVVAVLSLWTCLEWLGGSLSVFYFAALVATELVVSGLLNRRVVRVLRSVERRARDLSMLASLSRCLEKGVWKATRLLGLQEHLMGPASRDLPSQRIAWLASLVELLNSRRNGFFAPIAYLLLWGTQVAYALEAWRARHGRRIGVWLEVIAEFEALCSLAGYALESPGDPFPEIVEGLVFEAEGLGHPLLPVSQCVRNDLTLGETPCLFIISGSNMSGKSTFLRAVGVNTVLALAGAPVRARRLQLSPFVVGATLRIQDSLQAGISRFYAELLRVRQIVDLSRGRPTLLFLLDELFAGTNSHDRRIGADAVVRGLVEAGAIGLITTHDLALTQIAEQLGSRARNVHFADHFEDGKMAFDYRLQPGVVQHSNALALMRAVGLSV